LIKRAAVNLKNRTSFVDEGVEITPIPVTEGESITIKYDGLLAKSGADRVYTHLGYGSSEQWKNIQDIPMMNTKDGWTCEAVAQEKRLNFCFHDTANNWDNNNGNNWSITVHNGDLS